MKRILIIGGNGFLGRKVSEVFCTHNLTSVDFATNNLAQTNIVLNSECLEESNTVVVSALTKAQEKYDSMFVTAGGWIGGSIKDDDYLSKLQQMNKTSLWPALLGAHLATKWLKPEGLIVFTGAAAVFKEPQPDMIAYALAKTGVHSLALNFAQKADGFKVLTILPEIIDSPSNRQGMPNADYTRWVKGQQIAQLLKGWVDGLNVPNNGSFVMLQVKNGCLVPTLV